MPILNLPSFNFKLKQSGKSTQILDISRKKYVALTPEEWVRQHLLHFLVNKKKFPVSLIAVEAEIQIHSMKKRCDLVAYSTLGKPLLVAECKAPSVRISQQVFDQAARYNLALHVPLLVLTNGLTHFCYRTDHAAKSFAFLPDIPLYKDTVK